MNRESFEQAADLFERARALDPDAREALFREASEPEEVVRHVRELLSHHEDTTGPLETTGGDGQPLQSGSAVPTQIGQYRVKERLGVGGMGVVFLAEQSHPRRDVAIKLVRRALVSPALLRRFDYEAAVLGRLKHPNIAQIYEASAFDDGSGPMPFIAMEYVDGVPLLQHARENGLSVRERLELFAHVCDAVHHAHQRGVIHRDIKPSNILVDSAGVPKVLDFGIARTTGADEQLSSLHTEAGRLLGTIAYMSPEQVGGGSADIDTRSDVYSLGVVLYELLGGGLPYSLPEDVVGAARVIHEKDPEPLSGIDRSLRADLDTIVRKALAKEPERRYQSAHELGEDIHRLLHDEPITARPTTTLYQLSRFARRNRALVAGAATTLIVIVAGAVVVSMYAAGQSRALAESERQRRITDAINAFLTDDLINQANPEYEPDRELTLREALDNASERIEGRFHDAPLVEANLRLTIGQAYRSLSRVDEAQAHLERARELSGQTLGEEDEQTLLCRMELAAILSQRTEYAQAERELRELLPLQRRVLGEDHVQTIATVNNLGASLLNQGRFEEAEPLIVDALERRKRVLGEADVQTATTMNNLAVLYGYTGRFEESAELLPTLIERLIETKGERHPQTLQSMANLGILYSRLGRIDESIESLERALELHREALGPTHRSTLALASALASLYGRQGLREEQQTLLTQTLEAQRGTLGEDHFDTLVTRMNLAKVSFDQGETERALREYAHLAERFSTLYPDHFFSSIVRSMQARCLVRLDRFDEAEAVLLEAYDHITSVLGGAHRDTKNIASQIAEFYSARGDQDAAEQWNARAQLEPEAP